MIAVFEWLHTHPWMMLPIVALVLAVGMWWGRRRPSSGPPYRWTPEPTEDEAPEAPKPATRPPRRARRAPEAPDALFPDIAQLTAPLDRVMRDLHQQVERIGGRTTTSWRVDRVGPTTLQIPGGSRVTLEDGSTFDVPVGQTRTLQVTPGMRVSVSSNQPTTTLEELRQRLAEAGWLDANRNPGNPEAKVRHVQETPKEPPKPRTWHERLLDDEDEEAPCLKKTAKSKD